LADLDGDGDWDLVLGAGDGLLEFYANGYCTTSCNSNGLCDPNTYAPVCQCLTGFQDHQCNYCQTGYFGLSCDLCPEGGGETKDAPRVTDTCGVKGSGRSRGTCDHQS